MKTTFDVEMVDSAVRNFDGDPSARIAERNRLTDAAFESGVRQAGWRRLRAGDAVELPAAGLLLVLGVAIWNAEDRDVLKAAGEKLWSDSRVAVFDLDEVRSVSELHAFMPFMALPLRTPVAAVYENGLLIRHASGSDVQNLVAEAAKEFK